MKRTSEYGLEEGICRINLERLWLMLTNGTAKGILLFFDVSYKFY